MKNDILTTIENKTDYKLALEALTGEKTTFSEEEKARLLAVYTDNAGGRFGFSDDTLVRALLVLDTAPENGPDSSPFAELLNQAALSALSALIALEAAWRKANQDPAPALAAKTAALDGDASAPLDLALARAALDALAGRSDLTPYRTDINALADFLNGAGDEGFTEASRFLVKVRGRVW